MFRKPLFLLSLFVATGFTSYAQQFFHSAGLTGLVMNGDIVVRRPGGNAKYTPVMVGLTYFPRISFPLSASASLSAGLPITLGAGFIDNDFVGIKQTSFAYDVPFVIDYNDAFKAAEAGDEKLGFYLGAGLGMTKVMPDSIPGSLQKTSSTGILVRGGIRIGFADDENNQGFTIGIFHRIGFEFARYKTTGITLLYDF
jgi:hypothetical protein